MRKLEKQAMLQAAKEARRQQGTQQPWAQNSPSPESWTESCKSHFMYCRTAIMAAEEKRKKREQMKLLKQQVSVYLFVSPLENPISAATSLWASNLKLSPAGQSGQPWRNLLFLKKCTPFSSSASALCTSPSSPHSPQFLCGMHDLTVNSFDLALILLPGEDQAHSANSYGARTPCAANSRGSSWKLLQKYCKAAILLLIVF